MRGFCIFVLVLVFSAQFAVSANPLGNCQGGRAVPYTVPTSGGACNIPTIGIPAATVNQAFFSAGLKCGVCYEVTGPRGTQVVQLIDQCPSTSNRCGGDAVNFGLENSVFGTIANRSDVDIIYDLGFREVTCDVTGNIQMKAVSADPANINTFFSLVFWNFRVGITDVRIQASGWSGYEKLNRQGTSAVWSWNKINRDLKFPITIYLVGSTNEVIRTQVSSLTQDATVDFGDQFTDVAGDNGVNCPMWTSGNVVYTDSVSYGWDTQFSFSTVSINTAYTTDPYMGAACASVVLEPWGGFQFTRLGGFNPQYFSYLTFAAKSTGDKQVRVYMGEGVPVISTTIQVTNTWTVFNISVKELVGDSTVETALVFQNNQNEQVQFYFDEISWQLNPESPLDPVTQVTTGGYQFNESATTGPIVFLDTTGTTGFSFGSDETSSAFTISANFAALAFAALLALAW